MPPRPKPKARPAAKRPAPKPAAKANPAAKATKKPSAIRYRSVKDEGELETTSTIIYAFDKAGKTSLAASWPSPVFLVPHGGKGASVLREAAQRLGRDDIEWVGVRSADEMYEVGAAVAEEDRFRTIVVDPATTYGLVLEREAAGRTNDSRALYAMVQNKALDLWHMLESSGKHTVWVFHMEYNEKLDLYMPQFPGRKTLPKLMANADFTTCLTKEDIVDYETDDEDDEDRISGTRSERYWWFRCPAGESPRWHTGNRFENILTEAYYEPYWSEIAKYLKGHVADV